MYICYVYGEYENGEYIHANCFAVHTYGTAYVPTKSDEMRTVRYVSKSSMTWRRPPLPGVGTHRGIENRQSPRRDNRQGNR